MKVLDLFSGVGGERRRSLIESLGFELTTLDINPKFNCNITKNILDINPSELGSYDFIWASCPCDVFSVASIWKYWTGGDMARIPKLEAMEGISIVKKTISIIEELKPKYWVIENPRGMLRTMDFMKGIKRNTVTYCRYGSPFMKPTDLFGELGNWKPRELCKNGNKDHASSPRGSKKGIASNSISPEERSVVPWELWEEILLSIKQE
jgi:C-5 cytosine-specific DNA methylase